MISRVVAALMACALVAGPAFADEPLMGAGAKDLPIFDGHMHYKGADWDGVSEQTILKLMDVSGVVMSLVSSSPNEGTMKLYRYAPNRILPEVQPYDGGYGQTNWTIEEGAFDLLLERLAAEAETYQGIGEIHVHFMDQAGDKTLRRVADLAAKRNLFVHIHGDYQTVDVLFDQQPKLRVLWAHAGLVDPPEQVMKTMNKYPDLYAELSYREHMILDTKGGLVPVWRDILMKHAGRLMIGSDTWTGSQWVRYLDIIEQNRQILSQLPKAKAEAMAYKNAERFFGRKLSRDLIGKR